MIKKFFMNIIVNSHDHYLSDIVLQNSSKFHSGIKENNTNSILKEKSSDIQSIGLPPLVEAEYGNVVTRFPPEPNGYPHIGHAKAAIIDEEYAKKYGGKLILRFDDTNPVKEKIEYYDAILEGIKWLKIEPSIIKNTSDDIEILYEYGKKLIKKNCAYVCECNSELIKMNRLNGISCICRTNDVDINLNKFRGYDFR